MHKNGKIWKKYLMNHEMRKMSCLEKENENFLSVV